MRVQESGLLKDDLRHAKVSTTIRLSPEVIDHFKAGGRGWQTRIDAALREWIRSGDAA